MKICRFGGVSSEALLAQVDRGLADVGAGNARSPFADQDRFRLAVVADSPDTLGRKLQLARGQFNNPAARSVLEQQGVFYRQLPATACAWSAYFLVKVRSTTGCSANWCATCRRRPGHGNRSTLHLCGSAFRGSANWRGRPPRARKTASPAQLGSDIWITQLAMLFADAIVLAALGERGIVPNLVLGHSYGEFAALSAAGAWDLETAIRLTRARSEGVATAAPQGTGLLATDAEPQLVERLAAGISAELFVANFNAPDQCVVGGRRAHLEALAGALKSQSRQARLLAVPAAFHTPLMHGASRLLEQALETAAIGPLHVPLVSTVTNWVVRDAADIRRNLANQLTTPVRYAPLIAATCRGAADRVCGSRSAADANPTESSHSRPGGSGRLGGDCLRQSQAAGAGAARLCPGAVGMPGAFPPPARPSAPVEPTSPSVSQPNAMHDPHPHSDIPHFDATERRRTRLRSAHAGTPTETQAATKPAATRPIAGSPQTNGAAAHGSASNGSASNGTVSNGTGSNGSAPHSAGSNGSASNGSASVSAGRLPIDRRQPLLRRPQVRRGRKPRDRPHLSHRRRRHQYPAVRQAPRRQAPRGAVLRPQVRKPRARHRGRPSSWRSS